MNIFHKTQKKETRKLPMTGKVKKGFRYYCAAVLSVTAVFATVSYTHLTLPTIRLV